MNKQILFIEDESAIRELVRIAITQEKYTLWEADCVRRGEQLLGEHGVDLILLDWMLPDESGVDLARRLKKDRHTRDIPIIMLTARTEESDKIRGFDVGVDDYLTKPFSPRELLARIKAVLRRGQTGNPENLIEFKQLKMDLAGYRLTIADTSLNLGPTEYRLLQFFLSHQERVFTRDQLLDRVWGKNVYIEDRTVDVHIRRLRKALEPHQYDQYIQTVRGAGYRFSEQV